MHLVFVYQLVKEIYVSPISASSGYVVTTFSGSGIGGYADGNSAVAKFNKPCASLFQRVDYSSGEYDEVKINLRR